MTIVGTELVFGQLMTGKQHMVVVVAAVDAVVDAAAVA